MKKSLLLLSLIVSALCSCRKDKPPHPYTESPDFQKAQSLLYKKNDSAYYYFNKVIAYSKDSLQIAMAHNQMALIQSDAGDYFGAQESLLSSLKYLNENNLRDLNCLSSDYNELGSNSFNLKNYPAALHYFEAARKLSKDKELNLVFSGNIAMAYQKMGGYNQAIGIYRQIIPQARIQQQVYARLLSNMARTKWLRDPGYNAAPEMTIALRIRKIAGDLWGQNASYAHLADYYSQSRPDSALFFAKEMYNVALRIQSPDDRIEALEKLIRLSPPISSKHYFEGFKALTDSVQAARNAAKNQFALIRYDAEKSKADNMVLQKDNIEKRYQIIKQQVLLYCTGFTVVAGLALAVTWYQRRKKRIALETRVAVRAGQLKLSKKVHDEVANGLYQVISEVENGADMNKELLLDKMDILYQRSRDISYEVPDQANGDFPTVMEKMILSFATGQTKVLLVGNDDLFWQDIGFKTRNELELVLRELMVNMRKHSQAGEVVIRFSMQGNERMIDYRDNGMGFKKNIILGNGLDSTGNRINHIRGTLIFEDNTGGGLHIRITFPAV